MESTWEKRRSILASGLAILMALALATSMTYAFPAGPKTGNSTFVVTVTGTVVPNNETGKVPGPGMPECLSEVPHVLNLPRNITLTENGTVSIAGMTYWYVGFVPRWMSLTDYSIVSFHGVDFSLSAVEQYDTSGSSTAFEGFINGTVVPVDFRYNVYGATVLTARTSTNLPCSYTLPQVAVEWGGAFTSPPTFSPSSWETFNKAVIETYDIHINQTTALDQENIYFSPPSSNPWFTQHLSPQAGVGYQTDGGEITLYVSTS